MTSGSLWLRGAERAYPPLDADLEVDVCVVGAGLVGATVAALLATTDLRVVVLERSAVGSGTTGNTTGKVTSGHGTIYSALERNRGADVAAAYAAANEEGLALVRRLVGERSIDCDLETKDNYVYTADPERVATVEEEIEAARRAGLDARLATSLDLPFEVAAAIHLPEQAQFDAASYVRGLIAASVSEGVGVHEDTRVTGVAPDDEIQIVRTETGHSVRASHVVLADHYPLLDRALLFPRVYPQRSYCVAGPVADPSRVPDGMYISIEEPTRSLRTAGPLLIVGGEGHEVGRETDTEERYASLERWAAEHLGMTPEYRWSAQDGSTPDGIPYIGPYRPGARVYVATGFGKWGLTNGTIGARTIVDQIMGRPTLYGELFDPARLDLRASAKKLVTENTKVGVHFVKDRVAHPNRGSLDELAPGQAAVEDLAFAPVAGYRDEAGVLHKVSAVCTHLGCTVAWNSAEKSWDCPCHGSRFDHTGRVLEGPATRDLERIEDEG